MGVAVMAACRTIAERTIKIMAGCTSIIGFNKYLIIMGGRAVCPVDAGGDLGAAAAEVALYATGIQVVTGAAIKRA